MVVYFEGLNFFPIFNFYEVVKQDSDKKTSGIGEHNIETVKTTTGEKTH